MLRFRLMGMPVTVRTSFLLIAVLLGFYGMGSGVEETIAWVAIVFISILVHELGHALTARMYGAVVAIELNGFGGLTRWSVPDGSVTPGQRALIAAAGSAVGIVLGGAVWLVDSQFGPYDQLVGFVLELIVFVNLFWGLLNWLPIRPLDGGHLLESLLEKVAPRRANAIARVVFITTAAAALVYAISTRRLFIAALAGWLLLAEFSTGRPGSSPSVPSGIPTLSYEDDEQKEPEPEDSGDPGESSR